MKEFPPFITIVVPVFNRASLLAEFLASLRAQDSRGYKLIVVDNGSTDGSAITAVEWAAENCDIPTKVLTESARGAARARQRGLEEVDTDWTLFFDSDDLMLPCHMARVMEAIEAMPGLDILGWDVKLEGYNRSRSVFVRRPSVWTNIMNGTLSTQRYCARTRLLREVGGWNPEVGLWDDIELGTRLLSRRPKMLKLEGEMTVVQRFTGDSITGRSFVSAMERMEPALRSMEKYLESEELFITDLKRAQAYGAAAREGSATARALQNELLGRTPSVLKRLWLRWLYGTVKLGVPGTYLLLKPLYHRPRR